MCVVISSAKRNLLLVKFLVFGTLTKRKVPDISFIDMTERTTNKNSKPQIRKRI